MPKEPYSEDRKLVKTEISLPIDRDHFIEFISGLLGKPQSIEKTYAGQFEISVEDIINTHHLVAQRLNQQNDSALVQFIVSVSYDDGSTVHLNSLHDFQSYREVKPLVCVSVNLTWVYLVKFQKKDAPEKQQIDLTFSAGNNYDTVLLEPIIFSSTTKPVRLFRHGIKLRIEHTERTWGNDIESLLDGHIKTLIREPKNAQKWVSSNNGKIGLLVGILFFLGAIYGSIRATQNFIEYNKNTYIDIIKNYTEISQKINEKIDYIANALLGGVWNLFDYYIATFLFVSFFTSIFLGIWVSSRADTRRPSFILISQESKNKKIEYDNKHKRDWAMFFISVVISLVIGIVSNIIFNEYVSEIL
ncbi:hypothetical protein J0X12_14235 [Sneathiella sp. CAU 1612]|uniref:Uncharacterized protein n=1 Tax=Sneathiella sedimenti TaxID=2816034 RepID=A0ABS3F9L1_9PROT|nr:hypothetical protein [Sneathiella sedimenti]MBO0334781.1 hypothetical protein [Sneathiella sedimenti]